MKTTGVLLLAVLCLAGFPRQAGAQSYEVSTVETLNGSTLDVDIMIGASSPVFVLGTSSFVLNYDPAALSSPARANIGPWSSSDLDYNLLSLSQGTGFAGLTVTFIGGDDNNGPQVVSGLTRVGTIRFTVVNPGLSPGLSWRNIAVNTQVFRLTDPGNSDTETDITNASFFVAPSNLPLPVTVASFSALPLSDAPGVTLTWNTVSEIQNYGFFIQRRAHGTTEFADLAGAFVPGHGTTTESHTYSFTDRTATVGTWVYRLRQQDLDGASHYSEEVRVDALTSVEESAPVVFALLQNYPNPFNPSTEIKFSVEQTGRTSLVLFNMIGQEVARLYEDVAEAGKYYRVRVDGTRLASGIYLYKLENGKQTAVKRMMLLK